MGTGTHNRPPAFCGLASSPAPMCCGSEYWHPQPATCFVWPVRLGCTAVPRPWMSAPTTGHLLSAACRARWATGCLQWVVVTRVLTAPVCLSRGLKRACRRQRQINCHVSRKEEENERKKKKNAPFWCLVRQKRVMASPALNMPALLAVVGEVKRLSA